MTSSYQDYPQTDIQTIGPLFLQLHNLGFPDSAVALVDEAYHLAMKLWAVNFQSSSRPFLCHAVGTASHVAVYGGNLNSVLAGLLHAAYSTGDFGVRVGGATERKRERVRRVVGDDAEDLIYRFYRMLKLYGTHWERALEDGDIGENDRTVFFIRVCNDMDDVTDMPFSSRERARRIEDFVTGSIKLAKSLDREDLAEELERRYVSYRELCFLPYPVQHRYPTGHVVLPPAYRKRLIPGILEVIHRRLKTGSWMERKTER